MKRLTVEKMILEDLGYCCLQYFFQRYHSTMLIAARLGVTERAVRYAKVRVRKGEGSCSKCKKCLERVL
jgi:hypothetical protein